MSVRPHGTTRLPLDGFSWNLTFEFFRKMCQENSSFIKMGQEKRVLYIKTNIHFWSYLTLFLEREMFQTKVVEKIKTHILCSTTFLQKTYRSWYNLGKRYIEPDRPQMTIWRMRIACWIPKAVDTRSEYVIIIVFQLQQSFYKGTSVLRYTVYCLSVY